MARYIGSLIGLIQDGRAVARCSEAPGIGDAISDRSGRRVGRVSKVFGPIDRPYISLSIEEGLRIRPGTEIFAGGSRNGSRQKRRGRRDNRVPRVRKHPPHT